MERPPTEYSTRRWLKEANARLPVGERETVYLIAGYPLYRFIGAELWHLPGPDAAGHRRARRRVAMLTKAGCRGWNLRRNGCAIWVGLATMRRLLVRA
ncbi:MAG: hypothetical protein NVS3B25_33570 [Hymenobacter sp.]